MVLSGLPSPKSVEQALAGWEPRQELMVPLEAVFFLPGKHVFALQAFT